MRKMISVLERFLFVFLLLLPVDLFAEPEGGKTLISGETEIGGRAFLNGGPSERDRGKFEEYRDIPPGLFLEKFLFRLEQEEKGYIVELQAQDAGEKDQNFLLRATKLGRYAFEFEWNQIPHHFSNTARTPYVQTAPGVYELPNSLQTQLQGASAAARPGILQGYLSALPDAPLGTRWDIARFLYRSTQMPNVDLQIEYTVTRKQGTRPIGTTFAFTNQVELPEPIDQKIDDVRLSVDLVKENWQLQFSYNLSVFHNDVNVLIWDNPLRDSDSATAPARGLIDLPPSNVAHTLGLSGGADLPMRGRLTAALSYSWRFQDDPFVPHTINLAISDPGLALPADSLNGEVQVQTASLRYVGHPLETLSTNASYRLYNLVNNTPEYTFPAQVTGDSTLVNEPVTSSSFGYMKQNGHLGFGWQAREALSVGLGYDWERWDRNEHHREAPRSDEHTPKLTFDYRAMEAVLLRLSYAPSWRRIDTYNPFAHLAHTVGDEVGPDATQGQHILLRKYDEADRNRQRFDFLAQTNPTEAITFTPTFSWRNDHYTDSAFGLQNDRNWAAGFDFSWNPTERVVFFLGYMREEINARQTSRYREPPLQLDNPTYDWVSDNEDTVNTLSANADLVLVPQKLDLLLAWSYSKAVARMHAFNPIAPSGGTPTQNAAATAADFPNITERLGQLEATLRYHIQRALQVKFRYLMEVFNISDFRTDEVAPFMGGVEAGSGTSIYLGAQIRDYAAHLVAVSLDYQF